MKTIGRPLIRRQQERAIIVDLDGTLCDNLHRQHLWGKDSREFFEQCAYDKLFEEVRFLIQCVFKTTEVAVIFCTGRPYWTSARTTVWLHDRDVPYTSICFRDDKDKRPDVVVKLDMLEEIRAAGYEVILSIDDRPEVVAMWRQHSVPCLQVDPITWRDQRASESTEEDPKRWLKQMSDIPGADPMYRRTLDYIKGMES